MQLSVVPQTWHLYYTEEILLRRAPMSVLMHFLECLWRSTPKKNWLITCCGNTATVNDVKSIFNKRLVDLAGNIDLLSNLANFHRPISWWASSLKAQWPHEKNSNVAFKWSRWLNSSLSSRVMSSLSTFGSDKNSIRLLFLARLWIPSVVWVLSDPYQLLVSKGDETGGRWLSRANGTFRLCYIGSLLILIISRTQWK